MASQGNQDSFLKKGLEKLWAIKEIGIIVPTLFYAIIVQAINPVFMTQMNLTNLFRQTGFVLIPALGMTFVLIAAGIDLSVGSLMGFGGIVVGTCMMQLNLPIWLSICITLLFGVVLGLINGAFIIKFTIPPMIMTLGMMYMARGVAFVTTKGLPIYPIPQEFQAIEQGNFLGLPTIIPICIVLCLAFHFMLTRTTFGRSVYAIGGNIDAAKLSGINTRKVTIKVYALCGFMASLAGVLMSARLGSGQPNAGEGYEMNVIAACIIGGTSTFGGRGTVLGTTIGALFMSILSNSLTLMKVDVYYQKLVIGAVLVVAVILDQYKREMDKKRIK